MVQPPCLTTAGKKAGEWRHWSEAQVLAAVQLESLTSMAWPPVFGMWMNSSGLLTSGPCGGCGARCSEEAAAPSKAACAICVAKQGGQRRGAVRGSHRRVELPEERGHRFGNSSHVATAWQSRAECRTCARTSDPPPPLTPSKYVWTCQYVWEHQPFSVRCAIFSIPPYLSLRRLGREKVRCSPGCNQCQLQHICLAFGGRGGCD